MRTVAADPADVLLDAYARNPSAIRGASFELAVTWFTDVVPPGGGKSTLDAKFDTKGLHGTFSRTVHAGVQPADVEFAVAEAPGRELVSTGLDSLSRGGWWRITNLPEPNRKVIFMEGHGYSVHVHVSGTLGDADFKTDLPYQFEHEAKYKAAVDAFKSTMKLLSSAN